jgi:hypothetical protein
MECQIFKENEVKFIGGGYWLTKFDEDYFWMVEYGSMTFENPYDCPIFEDILFVELALCIDTLKLLKLLEIEPIPVGMSTGMECTRWALNNFAEFGLKGFTVHDRTFVEKSENSQKLTTESTVLEIKDNLKTFKPLYLNDETYNEALHTIDFEIEIDLTEDNSFSFEAAQKKIKTRMNRIIPLIERRKSMKDFRSKYKLFCENNNNE